MTASLGALLQTFLVDELPVQKGFRPASIKAYRDGLRLFLTFVATDRSCRLTQLTPEVLTSDCVRRFLQHLEDGRHNHRRTRNHRLTILRTFFEFLARRSPEVLDVAHQVASIAVKRAAPAETRFLEREQIERLFHGLPSKRPSALRDHALLLLLYNTGARVQEIADLRVEDLQLDGQLRATPRKGR
jgi:site-specific recombinase XerD